MSSDEAAYRLQQLLRKKRFRHEGGVETSKVQAIIVAKLDRLPRSVKDLCELLERFERRGVALIFGCRIARYRLRLEGLC
jgi:DNA invertase Pin-like site-specific DNA recombinase